MALIVDPAPGVVNALEGESNPAAPSPRTARLLLSSTTRAQETPQRSEEAPERSGAVSQGPRKIRGEAEELEGHRLPQTPIH